MFWVVRKGCGMGCFGCLLPVALVLGLVLLALHLLTTSPGYQPVAPASPAALQLAGAQALGTALAEGQPAAVVNLTDADATALLRDSVSTFAGLSDLQVHVLAGKVVVTGRTAIVDHPLVVSGTVELVSGGGSQVTMKYTGVAVGQLGLPPPVPQILTHDLAPQFNLAEIAGVHDLEFTCGRAMPNDLLLGVALKGTVTTADRAVCRATP